MKEEMTKFYIELDLLNSAMQSTSDIAKILRDFADSLDNDDIEINDSNFHVDANLRDYNGNKVGKAFTK